MNGFIYELFKKKSPVKPVNCIQPKHKALLGRQAIKDAILELKMAKTALSIFIPGFKKPAVSYILSIKDDSLELDLLRDPSSHQALIGSESFRVVAKQSHIDFVFDAYLIAYQEGDSVYSILFPEKIYHPQRREAFRLALPEPIKLTIDIFLPGSETVLTGRIINLSVMGAAFVISSEFNVSPGEIIENCVFHFLGGINIKLNIRICTTRYLRFNAGCVGVRVGCSFLALSHETEQILSKFITHCELRLRENRSRTG